MCIRAGAGATTAFHRCWAVKQASIEPRCVSTGAHSVEGKLWISVGGVHSCGGLRRAIVANVGRTQRLLVVHLHRYSQLLCIRFDHLTNLLRGLCPFVIYGRVDWIHGAPISLFAPYSCLGCWRNARLSSKLHEAKSNSIRTTQYDQNTGSSAPNAKRSHVLAP